MQQNEKHIRQVAETTAQQAKSLASSRGEFESTVLPPGHRITGTRSHRTPGNRACRTHVAHTWFNVLAEVTQKAVPTVVQKSMDALSSTGAMAYPNMVVITTRPLNLALLSSLYLQFVAEPGGIKGEPVLGKFGARVAHAAVLSRVPAVNAHRLGPKPTQTVARTGGVQSDRLTL